MKKIAIIILSSFVAAFVFSFSLAFAAEGSVKVYYSESLGTKGEQKVYHVSSCLKALSFGPVRCLTNPEDDTKVMFEGETGDQCRDKDGAILDMAYVRGCYKKDTSGQVEYMDERGGTAGDESLIKFPKVEVTLLKKKSTDDPPGCADKPENQGPLYAPEWAIVKGLVSCIGDYPPPTGPITLLGTVVWPNNNSSTNPPTPKYITDKFGAGSIACPMYRAVLCDEYDVINTGTAESPNWSIEMPFASTTQISDVVRGRYLIAPKPTSDDQCNTNNSNKEVPELALVNASTMTNAENTYSCTTKYRITGNSGSDVLAKYIGALYKWAAGLVGIISVLIIVFSGIQISAAGGDSAKLDTAKNRIAQSLIGIVILFLAGLILYTINPTFFVG